MPSIRQSIRSSTASKRPTSAIADGQIALNTASGTPGIFFKDNANNIIKAGPAHYGASAPNSSPAVGGSTGNSIGEAWLDSSLTPAGWKIWNGSAWVNATPLSSDTVQGLVELATNAEVQAGVDTARAVTAAGLQSKVSDSISTTSSSGIASSSAVKTAYDLANAALPKSGGIITGNLEIGSTGSFTFEGATADGFETTLAVVDPTADRTITFPDITGTVITTADTGTVTSTMIANGTIVDADINSSAAIAFSKLASLASANILIGNASGVPTSTTVSGDVTITNAGVTAIASNVIVNADINSAAAIAYSKLALASGIVNTDISASAAVAYSKLALSNSIVNADINSAAAIAGTKISPDFGSQNLTTTGNITATNHIAASGTATTPSIQVGNGTTYKPGVYSPGTDQVALSTNGTGRLFVDSTGRVGAGTSAPQGSLHVHDGAATISRIRLTNSTTTDASGKGLLIAQNGVDLNITNNETGFLAFATSASERMRLTSAGLLGLGTTSPDANLDVVRGSNGTVATFGIEGLTINPRLRIDVSESNNTITLNPNYAGATSPSLVFNTQETERMRIDSSGRVGIGTSSPAAKLDVWPASSSDAAFRGNAGVSTQVPAFEFRGYNTNSTNGGLDIRTNLNSTFTDRVRITNDGLVGIGTTSPDEQLTLTGNIRISGNTPDKIVFSGDGTKYLSNIGDASTSILALRGRAGLIFNTGGDATYNGGSERARIDSSGRLLVGTSSTASAGGSQYAKLQVKGNTFSDSGGGVISVLSGTTTPASGVSVGAVLFAGTTGNEFGRIECIADAATGASDYPGRLVFSTTADGAASPTERMRITSAGRVELGDAIGANTTFFSVKSSLAANPIGAFYASSASYTGTLLGLSADRNTTNGTYNFLACTREGVAFSLFIRDSGNVVNENNSYGAISDAKLKENIVDANSQWDDLKALQVRNYNFKKGQTHTQIGLVAQEVELVSPGLVSESPDRDEEGNDLGTVTKSVNYSVLYMKAVKALQEAMERIEALEADVAALKGA